MIKKSGFVLFIIVVCAFLGYQGLRAASSERRVAAHTASTTNVQPTKADVTKPGEAEELARARAAKLVDMQAQRDAADESGEETTPEVAAQLEGEKDMLESIALSVMDRQTRGEYVSDFDKQQLLRYLEENGDAGQRGGREDPLDWTGGPDGASYYYVDNQNGDSANTYAWIELRGNGETYINSWSSTHDDSYSYVGSSAPGARHPIGFSFPFYGVNQDSFRLCTNGFLQFTTTATSLTNGTLPSSSVTGPAIFPYWDDLHLDRNGQTTNQVMYRNFGTYTVIEYDSIGVYNSTCGAGGPANTLKFEVILFNDGKIKIQYNTVGVCDAQDSSMTVGIQSNGTAGSPALQYGYGSGGQTLVGHLPASGTAIWFYQFHFDHDFAATSITSPSGYYLPNTLVTVTARFTNVGNTTESSPVKYQFNGGPIQTEATGSLPLNGFEDHNFTTQITTPAAPGAYTITVWSDLATDQVRGNDTLRATVQIGGDNCTEAIVLSGFGPDSALFNNCAMTDDTPGQPCGASGKDLVFQIDVPNGYQAVLWQTSNTIDSRHSLRWGGACPGTNLIDCQDSPDEKKMRFTNQTGSTQTAWLVVGGYSTATPCGNVKVAWQLMPCGPTSVPFIDGFEGVTAPLLPNCWGTWNGGASSTTAQWEGYTTTPRTGTNCASLTGTAVPGNDDWLFSPGLSLTGGTTYIVEFWRRATSATVAESLEVKAGTTNVPAGMTIVVASPDTFKTTAYVQKLYNLTPPVTGVYYIGWHSMTNSSSGRTRIDDVQVYPSGSCSAPTVTVNGATGQDSVGLLANVVGGAGGPPQYQWFTGTGCQEANRIVGATAATYYAHTSGTYCCRAWIIDSLTCASCDSAIATVIDCSAPTALPWSEGFESTTGTAVPSCWNVQEYDTDGRRWQGSGNTPHTGTRSAWVDFSASGVVPHDWLFTPRFQLTAGTNYLLDFWWRQYLASTSWNDSLQVLLTTAANNVSTVATIVPEYWINNVGTYQENSAFFTPPSTGTYYIAFLYQCGDDEGGVLLDDFSLAVAGTCTAPTVNVADSSRVGSVIMACTATGGSGGSLVYQWYTGQTCTQANAIAGATNSTYTTFVTGDYSCRAYRADSVNCAGCDWGTATVLPPPPGETCLNPVVVTPPTPGNPTVVNGTTTGYIADCRDTCNGGAVVFSPDIFYSLTLTSCRRITMSLQNGTSDMQISVFEDGHCCERPILCDDDLFEFDTLSWETPGQRPTGTTLASFVGGELPAGTYIIRASYYSLSGPLTVTIYDNGPCGCDLVCSGGDMAEAAEDHYQWSFYQTDPDGGCNDLTPTFGTIVAGQTVCGVGFDYLHAGNQYRDTDWYTFTMAATMDMNWTVQAEFPVLYGFLGGTSCPNPTFTAVDSAAACSTRTLTANLAPGDYVAFVSPLYFIGNPMPSTYRATLASACTPDTVANLTAYLYNGDGDPTANDIRLKWTANGAFTGTYSVYTNTVLGPFPGTWQLLTPVGLPPVIGPNAMTFVHDDALVGGARRFYIVISQCP